MPRRRERRPPTEQEREEALERVRASVVGPSWAQVEGMKVQSSVARKSYLCPYCNGTIAVGTTHVVAYPEDRLDDRRHYHSACWSKQSKRPRF